MAPVSNCEQSIGRLEGGFSVRPCAPSASLQAPILAFDALPSRPCSGAAERPCALVWKTRQRCRGRQSPKRAATSVRADAAGPWRAHSRLDRKQQRRPDLGRRPKSKWSHPSPLDSPNLAARRECSTTKALSLALGTIANHFDLRTFKFGSQLAIAPGPL